MTSFIYTNSTESSLEWDYNDNHTQVDYNDNSGQQPNYNTTHGSAAKRLFSWDFDISNNSSGKCPRLEAGLNSTKALTYKEEFENFEKIMLTNIKHFEVQSDQLQSPVKFDSLNRNNRTDKALQTVEKSKAKVLKLKTEVHLSKDKLLESEKLASQIKTETEHLEDKCRKLTLAAKEGSEKLASMKTILENKEDLLVKAKERISMEVSYFEKYLGLKLVNSTHEGIIFVFTNISRDATSKQFCFELLLSDRIYEMKNCHPWVRDTGELVKKLNSTGDLSGFVSQVRKRFLAMEHPVQNTM